MLMNIHEMSRDTLHAVLVLTIYRDIVVTAAVVYFVLLSHPVITVVKKAGCSSGAISNCWQVGVVRVITEDLCAILIVRN